VIKIGMVSGEWAGSADTVDGFHASQTPAPNTIPVADSSNKIADGWLNFVANDPKVKTALNASGDAPIYACRAWVNFNGTTNPPTIRASGNVSSIIKNGTGDYTINFIVSLPDVNYATVFGGRNNSDGLGDWLAEFGDPATQGGKTTTSLRVVNWHASGDYKVDISTFMVAIFR
jgi:hypothetical protein